MDAAAQAHLAGLLDDARQLVDAARTRPQVSASAAPLLSGYTGALDAFVAAGLVAADERGEWLLRMYDTLGVELDDAARSGIAGGRRGVVPAEPADGPKRTLPAPPVPAGSLVRTVVAPPVSWEHAGGRFQILSVEVYEQAITVTGREHPLADPVRLAPGEWAAAEAEAEGLPEAARTAHLERVRHRLAMRHPIEGLDDDIGTVYAPTDGTWGGRDDERRGVQTFVPAPPAAATRLTVRWRGHPIEVPLPPVD